MTTINTARNKTKMNKPEITSNNLLLRDADFAQLNVEDIEFSPLNYRKYFSEEALQDFAEELKQHGMISPITVRPSKSNRYELVAGERRIRAAKIAGLVTVPAAIVSLTDEQVTEIQLAENLQRENPHPMDEAQAIKRMQDINLSLDEIALRLGKSKKLVYGRAKLLNLIEAFREVFYANVISLQQALELATISQEGQEQFFEEHCKKWKQKNFSINDLNWYLRQYRYDLKDAPFDTKDKKLLPEVGACSGCSFNSATNRILFPELAKEAVCLNAGCFQRKSYAGMRIGFLNALQIHEPVALIVRSEFTDSLKEVIQHIPEAESLKQYRHNEITLIEKPEEPEREDYTNEDDDDEPVFDAEGYQNAVEEYQAELTEYQTNLASGNYQKGLYARGGDFYPVLFSPEPPPSYHTTGNSKAVSMKTVQEALKAGTATPELLQEAIQATLQREERAKELDVNKVHLEIHRQFEETVKELDNNLGLTAAENVAIRLLVYQSLDFHTKHEIDTVLFPDTEEETENLYASFSKQLQSLTDAQFGFMVRMAIVRKHDSKYIHNHTGYALHQMADAIGINIAGIEYEQEEKATARNDRMQSRIKELQTKAKKLKKKKS